MKGQPFVEIAKATAAATAPAIGGVVVAPVLHAWASARAVALCEGLPGFCTAAARAAAAACTPAEPWLAAEA